MLHGLACGVRVCFCGSDTSNLDLRKEGHTKMFMFSIV